MTWQLYALVTSQTLCAITARNDPLNCDALCHDCQSRCACLALLWLCRSLLHSASSCRLYLVRVASAAATIIFYYTKRSVVHIIFAIIFNKQLNWQTNCDNRMYKRIKIPWKILSKSFAKDAKTKVTWKKLIDLCESCKRLPHTASKNNWQKKRRRRRNKESF